MDSKLGFKLSSTQLINWVFIPKYYDPNIVLALEHLKKTHDLIKLKDLVNEGYISISTGDEIGKMAYGTGKIPFIRTSDISNWEIKTDPKQGVSSGIYDKYATKQDVRAGDIFFVRDGTYLIGQSAYITENDLPCLYQSHILKFRINKNCPINSYLFFILLNTTIVKKQIKARQFTADIIDTIGNRYLDLVLPVPKDQQLVNKLIIEFDAIINNRTSSREAVKKIPLLTQGVISDINETIKTEPNLIEEYPHNLGFKKGFFSLVKNIFMPKYYDPKLTTDLNKLKDNYDMISLQELIDDKVLSSSTGIEVGKLAYGTGVIPFIRTSDISNWEIKVDPKQGVSEQIYEANKQDVKPEDIFVVRDGTYLVGTSCMITESDKKILYCGGLYKLRIENKDKLDPYLLLALLNTPIVKRQMRSKQFTRDIIDTLGKRLFEIVLPIPRNPSLSQKIIELTKRTVNYRIDLRNQATQLVHEAGASSTNQI